MIVAPIPVGARLVDCVTMLSPVECKALKEAGVDGLICYLGGNLTGNLIANAHALGMGIVPVNYSRAPGWTPTAEMGAADAKLSTLRLDTLRMPQEGLVDWCDLEGCASDPSGYLEAWGGSVIIHKRIAGLYIGAGELLNAQQLYALPTFTRYWGSQSRVPIPECGVVLQQLFPTTSIAGVSVDVDFAQHDWKGRSATWVVAG